MKKPLSPSAGSLRVNRKPWAFLLLLTVLFSQPTGPVLGQTEKCKVGDLSVAAYNKLGAEEQKEKIENLRRKYEPEMKIAVDGIKRLFPGAPFEVKSRIKTAASLQEKIVRRGYPCFSSLTDVAGVRIIIPDYAAIPIVTNMVENEFDVTEKKYIINNERGTGYRAIHYIVVVDGRFIELQIHTVRGTIWASLSHKLVYKGPHKESSKVDSYFKELSRAIYLLDSGLGGKLPPIPADLPAAVKGELQKGVDSIRKYGRDRSLFSTMADEGSKTMQEESLLDEMRPGP